MIVCSIALSGRQASILRLDGFGTAPRMLDLRAERRICDVRCEGTGSGGMLRKWHAVLQSFYVQLIAFLCQVLRCTLRAGLA